MATPTEEVQQDVVAFCDCPPDGDDETDTGSPAAPPDGAFAVVCTSVLWQGREKLKVFFLNPNSLTTLGLTTATIIEWANGTPEHIAWGEIMEFKETKKRAKADIRIEFTETGGSWSMVGMYAETKVRDTGKPTMMLNLTQKYCPNEEAQRSLVIHEFGHALGLDHEHQRSDFWDGVEKHIDMDKMRKDKRVEKQISKEGQASFGKDWFKDAGSIAKVFRKIFRGKSDDDDKVMSEYDPDSIMHYGFDVKWLKNRRYHTLQHVKDAPHLSDKEKAYLKGIHKRHGGLAKEPSETDLDELRKAYNR